MLTLNAEATTISDASDREVEKWHEEAREGRMDARNKLCCWAYVTAHEYFHAKARAERSLTSHDAEELTSEFFVEFERTLPRIRTATRFTRRMLKYQLVRYIERERRDHKRKVSGSRLEDFEFTIGPDEYEERPWKRWGDAEWHQYRATLQVLQNADATTRSVVESRLRGLSYKQIAANLNVTEAALRMRVARFYQSVRRHYDGLALANVAPTIER